MRKKKERIYVYVVSPGAEIFEDLINLVVEIIVLILKIPRKYKLIFLGCMSFYLIFKASQAFIYRDAMTISREKLDEFIQENGRVPSSEENQLIINEIKEDIWNDLLNK